MTTAATSCTHNQLNMDISTTPKWFSWDFNCINDIDAADSPTYDLLSLPIGSIIHDVVLTCKLEDTGATTTRQNLLLETLTTNFYPGTADNPGVTGVTDVVEMTGSKDFPLAAADVLQTTITVVGDATSVGAESRVSVLVSRNQRP